MFRADSFVRRRLLVASLLVLAVGLGRPESATAQGSTGIIAGIVADAQGGVLPGVTVTARNVETGVMRSIATEANGRYRIAGLPPGRYDLKAELEGFAAVDVKDITLTVGLEVGRAITLQVQGVQESLTVTGQAPVVETTKTDVSGTITQEQIATLPIDSRQPVALALLMPGTSQDAVRPRKFNANVGAGAYTNGGAFLIDGVWNKEPCTGEPRQDYPQAAIREFKVNVSQATAEYGWTASGVVTIVTKGGTNLLSGEVFEYFRDKSLNTLNRFEKEAQATKGTPKPDFRRNQFGAAIGGPIIKDKLHYFVAAERTKTEKATLVNTGKSQFYSSVEGSFPIPEYSNVFFARGDWQISAQQNTFFRFAGQAADYTCDTCGGINSITSDGGINQPRKAWAGGHTWVIGSRALNEVRGQWSFYGYYPHLSSESKVYPFGEYPAERTANWTQQFNFPSLKWGAGAGLYVDQWAREIRDDFSVTANWKGAHTWKFGGAIKNLPDNDDVTPSIGVWTFTADQLFNPSNASVMANLKGASLFTASTPPILRSLPNQYAEIYLQDEWRPTSNITLSLGLRYDYQPKVLNTTLDVNDKTIFPTAGTATQVPFMDLGARGDKNNVAPRVGLAWDLKNDGKSVVRAGYGIYYNPIFSNQARGEQTNFRQANISISNPSYPDPYGGRSPLSFASTAPQNISIIANNLQNPRSVAYTVGLSQSLGSTVAVHVDGVYNKMTQVMLLTNINPRANGTTGVRPLAQFARIDQLQSTGHSDYKALLVRLDKRLSNRYMYLLSYTLAKGQGNIPFTGNSGRVTVSEHPEWDEGPAANDRRHVVVASGAVLLPFDIQLGAVWTLRSTMPFNAVAGRDLNGDGIVTDPVPGTMRAQGNRNLDFSLINTWRAANGLAPLSASQIDTNDYNGVDMRVNKSFSVGGAKKIELIAQVFNVFGRDNLSATGGVAGGGVAAGWSLNALSDSFGRILQAYNKQQAELAIRLTF